MWPPGFMYVPGVGGWGGSCETVPVFDAATFPVSDVHPVHPSRLVNQLRTVVESDQVYNGPRRIEMGRINERTQSVNLRGSRKLGSGWSSGSGEYMLSLLASGPVACREGASGVYEPAWLTTVSCSGP
jgi:hypothetical protein